MAGNKTVETDESVEAFLSTVENPKRLADARVVLDMMTRISGEPAKMWGGSLIGFGSYHYVYDSGREGDFFMTGLSPRKTSLTVYLMPGFEPYQDLLSKLGKYKTGKSCLYINKLEDVDTNVLETLVATSYADMKAKYHGD